MKKFRLSQWACIGLLALSACTANKTNEFLIKGTLTGNVPNTVYLQRYENKKMNTIDSAVVKEGSFELKGTLAFPEMLFIKLDDNGNKIGFFAENSHITIQANTDSLDLAIVKGSVVNDEYTAFQASKKSYETEFDTLYSQFKASQCAIEKAKLEKQLDSLDLVVNELSKKYVKEHPASIVSAYLINREIIYYLELSELENLTYSLDTTLKGSGYVKLLNERIDVLKTLEPGKPAPLFSQADSLGNPVSLESFKGKYLYIDFWASWCGPCRRANPTVVSVYQKYKDKNFTILGVSMDKDRQKWIEAIQKDGLVWSQVSTLTGWENPAAILYGVNSIPHGILIAPDGTIVKRSVEAGQLDAVLSGLIK